MRAADGTIIEVFEWESQQLIASGHSNRWFWNYGAGSRPVCTYEIPCNLAEF
jgi:hypothetical protein